MRWMLLAATACCWGLCFTRHSGAGMALWLLLGLAGLLVCALAYAQARIAANARDEGFSDYELQRLREGRPPLR